MSIQRRRLIVIAAVLSTWACIVLARLVDVQIVDHESYEKRAARQHQSSVGLTPLRGSIYDGSGRLLAGSAPAPSIYVDPQAIEDPDDAAAKLAGVSGLEMDEEELLSRLDRNSEFSWIARQVDEETWKEVEALGLKGVGALQEYRRSYPNERIAANVLGLVGIDGDGLGGLEHSLDQFVRGEPAVLTLLRDARRDLYLLDVEAKGPRHGYDLVLTIDEVIQFITEKALEKAVRETRARAASAIVMDPVDGSILAMASLPTFDPNRYGDFPAASWRNRAVQDVYEPGSTFKMVVAAAGIEERLVTPSQLIDCGEGFIVVADTTMSEHGGHQFGVIPFEDVLVHSSNVGIIRVGLALGAEKLHDYAVKFGYGEKTGIELPGESRGILRPVRNWSGLSTAAISIGQEIAATPLQIAVMTSTVANGGIRPVPRLVDRVVSRGGETIYEPPAKEGERVISARTSALVNEMLKEVVSRGTGSRAAVEGYAVAGKTGTAQKAERGGYSNEKTVASFAGYVPADRPRVVIVVLLDEPRSSQYGGEVAAPVFSEIAGETLRYLEVSSPSAGQKKIEIATGALETLRGSAVALIEQGGGR